MSVCISVMPWRALGIFDFHSCYQRLNAKIVGEDSSNQYSSIIKLICPSVCHLCIEGYLTSEEKYWFSRFLSQKDGLFFVLRFPLLLNIYNIPGPLVHSYRKISWFSCFYPIIYYLFCCEISELKEIYFL